jgi:membrane-associated phospholipid phosphatase
MTAISLSQLLTLYSWFVLTAVLAFLILIARFYQKFSRVRMYFRLFFIPVLLFGAAAVRYANIDRVAHDPYADLLTASGGVLLALLCAYVYYRMMAGRQPL